MVFQSFSCALEPQEPSPSTGTGTFLGPGHILQASEKEVAGAFTQGWEEALLLLMGLSYFS